MLNRSTLISLQVHVNIDVLFLSDEERIGQKRRKKITHFNNFFEGPGGGGGAGGGAGGAGGNFFSRGEEQYVNNM